MSGVPGLRIASFTEKPVVALAQNILLHLSHHVAWKIIQKHNALRDLELREPRFQARDHIMFLQHRPLAKHNNRRNSFSKISVRQTDDRAFFDVTAFFLKRPASCWLPDQR